MMDRAIAIVLGLVLTFVIGFGCGVFQACKDNIKYGVFSWEDRVYRVVPAEVK